MLRFIYTYKGRSKEVLVPMTMTLATNVPFRTRHNSFKQSIGRLLGIPTYTIGETKKFCQEHNEWRKRTGDTSDPDTFLEMVNDVVKYDDSVVFFKRHYLYRYICTVLPILIATPTILSIDLELICLIVAHLFFIAPIITTFNNLVTVDLCHQKFSNKRRVSELLSNSANSFSIKE